MHVIYWAPKGHVLVFPSVVPVCLSLLYVTKVSQCLLSVLCMLLTKHTYAWQSLLSIASLVEMSDWKMFKDRKVKWIWFLSAVHILYKCTKWQIYSLFWRNGHTQSHKDLSTTTKKTYRIVPRDSWMTSNHYFHRWVDVGTGSLQWLHQKTLIWWSACQPKQGIHIPFLWWAYKIT